MQTFVYVRHVAFVFRTVPFAANGYRLRTQPPRTRPHEKKKPSRPHRRDPLSEGEPGSGNRPALHRRRCRLPAMQYFIYKWSHTAAPNLKPAPSLRGKRRSHGRPEICALFMPKASFPAPDPCLYPSAQVHSLFARAPPPRGKRQVVVQPENFAEHAGCRISFSPEGGRGKRRPHGRPERQVAFVARHFLLTPDQNFYLSVRFSVCPCPPPHGQTAGCPAA